MAVNSEVEKLFKLQFSHLQDEHINICKKKDFDKDIKENSVNRCVQKGLTGKDDKNILTRTLVHGLSRLLKASLGQTQAIMSWKA